MAIQYGKIIKPIVPMCQFRTHNNNKCWDSHGPTCHSQSPPLVSPLSLHSPLFISLPSASSSRGDEDGMWHTQWDEEPSCDFPISKGVGSAWRRSSVRGAARVAYPPLALRDGAARFPHLGGICEEDKAASHRLPSSSWLRLPPEIAPTMDSCRRLQGPLLRP